LFLAAKENLRENDRRQSEHQWECMFRISAFVNGTPSEARAREEGSFSIWFCSLRSPASNERLLSWNKSLLPIITRLSHYVRSAPATVKWWIIPLLRKPEWGFPVRRLPDQCGGIINGLVYLLASMRFVLPNVISSIYLQYLSLLHHFRGSCLNLALTIRFSKICRDPLVDPQGRWLAADIVSVQVPNLRKKS
jgi:hypothetical protein